MFAACGMKIVLSGTDSLGFLFTEDEQLYDRCILLHTTFIPYREFESVLGVHGIDEYIRYGGTMSLGGVHYNETSTFASKESTDEYVDTAIARNIQHSLRCYQYEGHFRHLRDLYEKGELTSAINQVVEDINHRFTLEVLAQDWKSHDLGISASNLRRDRKKPTDILDRIDLALVTDSLRKLLEIRNRAEQTVALDDVHAAEIKEYLDLLDLTREIDVLHLPDFRDQAQRGSCVAAVSPSDRRAKMRPDRAPLRLDHRKVRPLPRGKSSGRRHSVSECRGISEKPCMTKPPPRLKNRGGGFPSLISSIIFSARMSDALKSNIFSDSSLGYLFKRIPIRYNISTNLTNSARCRHENERYAEAICHLLP